MRIPPASTLTGLLALIVALPSSLTGQATDSKNIVDFVKEIVPIFQSRCIECHGADEPEADLRLDVKKGLFTADEEDWMVVPGDPKKSELYIRITLPADDDDIMPAEGKPLTKKQIDLVRRWIEAGAPWPDGADAKIAAMLQASKPKTEKIELPVLTAAQKAAETKAIAALSAAGGLAMRVAANTTASEVNLSLLAGKATNAQLVLAADLAGTLVRLNLARTKIDDAGLEIVGGLSHLRWLNLSNTPISDAGLRHLSGLNKLSYLNLYGTKITDAGLRSLNGLKSLKKVYLWQTKATKAGAARLQKSIPGVRVDRGEYAELLAKIVVPKRRTAINKKCPVTGKPVAAGKLSVFQGQVVGLCCNKCKARFDKNPGKFIGKVKEFKPVTETVAANEKCPVRPKKAVVAGKVTPFRGRLIGFCCGKCKAAFEKNPEKFVPRLKGLFVPPAKKGPAGKGKRKRKGKKRDAAKAKQASVPVNTRCPVSGEAVDASQVSRFEGRLIGFCCGKCKAKFDKHPRKYAGKLK